MEIEGICTNSTAGLELGLSTTTPSLQQLLIARLLRLRFRFRLRFRLWLWFRLWL